MTGDDADRCLCGTVVRAHASSEIVSGGRQVSVERGSCTSCGLQLVRTVGEEWRHIRG